jgi:hypothetical protein
VTYSHESIVYHVRISVPRRGGWRGWLPGSGRFEQRLAGQESGTVISAEVETETRRGRDYVCINVLVVVVAAHVAEALGTAWLVFERAISDDPAGWDLAAATAEVKPGSLRLPYPCSILAR